MSTNKVWGTTSRIALTGVVQVELINVRPGGYCSVHRHDLKDNLFYVVSGCLTVRWGWPDGSPNCLGQAAPAIEQMTGLSSPLNIPAGVIHQFANMGSGPAVAVECYRAGPGMKVEPLDIKRYGKGGVLI